MALAVGEILQDRYRIDAELAQGGMAAVYWAWDTHLNYPVAVKEMIPQPRLGPKALTQLRRQFKREAHVLARLDHPNLVRVMDSFSQDDSEYLVMNYVEGESLADRVERGGALPEVQVLSWADQLLSALAYCHSQGVIHRDVKSHNVIIRPDGQAVLVDFGLVKLWDPDDPYTKTVMRGIGTPAFASPEQFEADEHTDVRSDIYGMGATLYHVLTGTLPPTAPLRTATPEEFTSLRSIVSEVSQHTETVVLKAMELARSQRWQSADEMAEALKVAQLSLAGRRPSPSFTVPLWRGVRGLIPGGQRKRVLTGIGALSILALLFVVVGLMIGQGGQGNRSTPTPSSEKVAAVSASAILTETGTATRLPVSTPVLVPSSMSAITATLQSTDTPSPTPMPTATPSLTSTYSPTPTATPNPIPTYSPTPTATPSPTMSRTPTPTRTATLTHTPTSTGEWEAFGTSTPVATPTPTVKPTVPLPQLYEVPRLLEPPSNQIFGFDRKQNIHLLWMPVSLARDHWYEVQMQLEEDEELRGRYWTKENWWDMGPEQYHPGDYYWRVIIVQGKEDGVVGAVSPPSETWYFEWLPVAPTSIPRPKPTSTPRPSPTNTKPSPTNTQEPTKTPRPTTPPTDTPTP